MGIFLAPAEMARALGSPFWGVPVWLAVGAAVLFGSVCRGKLSARYPEAGGCHVCLQEA